MVFALPYFRAAVLTPMARAFSPLDLPNLALWLDASRLTGLADGAAVATWPDLSGNGKDAVQPTGAKQPTFKVNILNGRPVVRFGGAHGLATPTIAYNSSQQVTAYCVCSAAAGVAQIVLESSSNVNSVQDAWALAREANNKVGVIAAAVTTQEYQSNDTLTTTHGIATARLDGNVVRERARVCVNGRNNGAYTTSSRSSTFIAYGNYPLNIGARNNGASVFLAGDIAEILVYAVEHTPRKRRQVEAYLAAKWGRALTPTAGTIVFDGHSATEGQPSGILTNWPYYLLHDELAGNYDTKNVAFAGHQVSEFSVSAPTKVDPWIDGAYGTQVIVCDGAANDLFFGASIATCQARITAYCAARKATGALLAFATIGPRDDTSTPVTFEADRQTLNAWLLANRASLGIDAIIDLGGDHTLGDAGDDLDTTYYNADKAHLNATGFAYYAHLVRLALNTIGVS